MLKDLTVWSNVQADRDQSLERKLLHSGPYIGSWTTDWALVNKSMAYCHK